MKKLFCLLLAIILLIPTIGSFNNIEVKAQSACDLKYELAYIEDDGSFTKVDCFDDFNSAKNALKEKDDDYVIRHENSLSPSKIIAMNAGVAYSYPERAGSNIATINIYQNVTDRSAIYKKTYIGSGFEMAYYDTERYFIDKNGNGVGMIQVNANGFEGYTDLEYTDLVPNKFLNKGIPIYLGGSDNEDPYQVKLFRNYYEVKENGNYLDIVFNYCLAVPHKGIDAYHESFVLGKASELMKANDIYYSVDGINFYKNNKYEGECITYYNYYQYLPLRSKTKISADVFNNFIKNKTDSVILNKGQDFIDAQDNYGVNALLLFAMAIHESAYGTSNYAKYKNNLFGWNAFDASPNSASTFNSVKDCINEQAGINLRGFLDINDGRFFSSSLGNKGSGLNVKYASDPYWGMKIASIAYSIDKSSTNKDGNYTDLNNYQYSLINTFDIDIKKEANQNSNTLFTSQYGPYYQKDFMVITLGNEGDYTKIQLTNALDENGNLKVHVTNDTINPISTYDYDLSIGYIENKYLSKINQNNNVNLDDLETFSLIDDIKFINNSLHIEGCAFIKGIDFVSANNISHEILFKNINNNEIVKTFKANTTNYDGISFNDNHLYKMVGFNIDIPLNDIDLGNYYLSIRINNNDINMVKELISYNDNFANLSINSINNYHLKINEIYGHRFELDVDSLPNIIDYNSINKPSTRPSLFSFDKFELDDDGNLEIYGQAMIYYSNFNNMNNIKYTIYLIDDSNNYHILNCDTLRSDYDYQKLLRSSYNMDYICFETKTNIKDFKAGNYQMIIKIDNGNYLDYLETTNISHSTLPTNVVNNKNFRFFTSTIRDRIMLEVK